VENPLTKAIKKHWRILTDPKARQERQRVRKFNREQGRGTPTRYGGLSAESVVFDLGGYQGEWTSDMRALYDCKVHVFEPHPTFAAALQARFADDPKVVCHDFALGSADGTLELSDTEDASSAFVAGGPHVTGQVRAAEAVIPTLGLNRISAMKINIEGGEYDILPHLIATGLIREIDWLSIQFHDYSSGDHARRDNIRAALENTHRCIWNYPFVWEQWQRQDRTSKHDI